MCKTQFYSAKNWHGQTPQVGQFLSRPTGIGLILAKLLSEKETLFFFHNFDFRLIPLHQSHRDSHNLPEQISIQYKNFVNTYSSWFFKWTFFSLKYCFPKSFCHKLEIVSSQNFSFYWRMTIWDVNENFQKKNDLGF